MGSPSAELPHPYPRALRAGAIPLTSPIELRTSLASAPPPVLLDIRPAAERTLASFPGDTWIPLSELANRVDELPRDRPIVAYDQFGAHARQAVGFLRGAGFETATALEGGIDEYARIVDPTIPRYEPGAGDGSLVLRQLPRRDTGCLAYFVGDPTEHEVVLIDPGLDVNPYLTLLSAEGWHLNAIVETHTHADHLAGHATLHQRTGAPILVSARSPAEYPHQRLAEGDGIEFGGEAIRVLETPGHTRDHLSLVVADKVFTGDTLLVGSCGRTDLGDGNPEALWESLTQKLLKLPDETEVLPAHFGPHHALPDRYSSTIGFERATNEAIRAGSHAEFLTYMTEGWPPKPAQFDRIVRENLRDF